MRLNVKILIVLAIYGVVFSHVTFADEVLDIKGLDLATFSSPQTSKVNPKDFKISYSHKKSDVAFTFSPRGVNQLFSIDQITYKNLDISTKITTDWIGPYIVREKNGIDQPPRFTGGFHGSNGDGTGQQTAITKDVEMITSNSHKDESMIIRVTNHIKGYNSHQPLIEEVVSYRLFKNQIQVQVVIKALEALVIEKYYGLQTQNSIWDDSGIIYYDSGRHALFSQERSHFSRTRNKDLTRAFRITNNKHNISLRVDLSSSGLGRFKYLAENQSPVFIMKYSEKSKKGYMNLINGKELELDQGEKVYWRGVYLFQEE